MKKLLHIITLSLASLSISYAEMNCYVFTDKDERAECERMNIRESMSLSQTRQNEKRRFIGFEGGYGHLDLDILEGLLMSRRTMDIFANPIDSESMNNGYMVSVSFGWQRYYSNKAASQVSRGFRYARSHKIGETGRTSKEEFKGGYINVLLFFVAYDRLFDFVRKGDKHFGLRIGGELDFGGSDISGIDDFTRDKFSVILPYIFFRTGLYFTTRYHSFDVGAIIPIIGIGGSGVATPTMAMVGYKYLF